MLPTSQVQFYIDEMNCISHRIFILEERSVWAGSAKPVIVNQSVTVFKLGKWLQKIVTFFFVKLWTAWVYNQCGMSPTDIHFNDKNHKNQLTCLCAHKVSPLIDYIITHDN